MKLLNSYIANTLEGTELYCGDMSDGSTWFVEMAEGVLYTTIDDLENGGFMLDNVHKCKVTDLPATPASLDQFVGHVNSFIEY